MDIYLKFCLSYWHNIYFGCTLYADAVMGQVSTFITLLLVLCMSSFLYASEVCPGYPFLFCSKYCCTDSFRSRYYCCDNCADSLSGCSKVAMRTIFIILGTFIFVGIALCFGVCLCCGCICQELTGKPRRNWRGTVISQPGQIQPNYGGVYPSQPPMPSSNQTVMHYPPSQAYPPAQPGTYPYAQPGPHDGYQKPPPYAPPSYHSG
jgi:hypothetical protein